MIRLLILLAIAGPATAQPIDLSGEWKINLTDNPSFAQPDLDDSQWAPFTLPRRDPIAARISWFRRTVQLPPDFRESAIVIGGIAQCYDLYLNGIAAGNTGCQPGIEPPFQFPHVFALPPGTGVPGRRLAIAIRVERRPPRLNTLSQVRDVGPYLITGKDHATDAAQLGVSRMRDQIGPYTLLAYTQFVLAAILFVFWLGNRERREILWFSIALFCNSCTNVTGLQFIYFGSIGILYFWFQPMALLILNLGAHQILRQQPLPSHLAIPIFLSTIALRLLLDQPFFFLPAWLGPMVWSAQSIRRGNAEQRAFSVGMIIYGLAYLSLLAGRVIPGWPIPSGSYIGPYLVSHTVTISTGSGFLIMVVLFRTVMRDRREKFRLASELEAARNVQQLLLPSAETITSSFTCHAAYAPALEVGGDFHYTRITSDQGLLLVIGDVSGKGVQAALLVSVAIGVLRNEPSESPAILLTALNYALTGHTGNSFITCCAARFQPSGQVTVANAGHLAPYRNGAEVEVAAGLPLGLTSDATYDETAFALAPGESLTMLSDGVVEAANSKGELFGFDRTRDISTQSARDIAHAAEAWGQNDDITVVTVRRRPC